MLSGCLRVATGVQVTVEGKRHLGAALGSRLFTEQYVSEKVDSWSCCIAKLSDIAIRFIHTLLIFYLYAWFM